MRATVAAALAALAFVVAGCGGSDDPQVQGTSEEREALPAPPEPAAPVAPGEPQGPGTLVAAHPLGDEVVPEGAIGWEVVYRSIGAHRQPIEVSGTVYAPDEPTPPGGRPVFTWGHPPTGMADRCAPSRTSVDVPYAADLVDAGFVVVATDYEGLGTPGQHPFLVGASAGHTVLDIARAAGDIEAAGAGSRVVAAGLFQGGQAALHAGMAAATHAPELELLGVVAGAPAAETDLLLEEFAGAPERRGLFAMAVAGYLGTYDELAAGDVLTEEGVDELEAVKEECLPGIVAAYADESEPLVARLPAESPPWAARIAENAVVPEAIQAPLLLLHGTADVVVPIEATDALVERLCGADRTLQYLRGRGDGHRDVFEAQAGTVLAWLDARLAREPARSSC